MRIYKILFFILIPLFMCVCYLYFNSSSNLKSQIVIKEKNVKDNNILVDSLYGEIRKTKIELDDNIKSYENKYKYELANFEKFKLESKFRYQKLLLDKNKMEYDLNQDILNINSKYDELSTKNSRNKREISELKDQNENYLNSLNESKRSEMILSSRLDILKHQNDSLLNPISQMQVTFEAPIEDTIIQHGSGKKADNTSKSKRDKKKKN